MVKDAMESIYTSSSARFACFSYCPLICLREQSCVCSSFVVQRPISPPFALAQCSAWQFSLHCIH